MNLEGEEIMDPLRHVKVEQHETESNQVVGFYVHNLVNYLFNA